MPDPDVIPEPDLTVTGWRWWVLLGDGRLASMRTHGLQPWPAEGLAARCFPGPWTPTRDHPADVVPWDDCTCGMRLTSSAAAFVRMLSTTETRTQLGLSPTTWNRIGGARMMMDRLLCGTTFVPDVIGMVDGWGRVAGPAAVGDPPGTFRTKYARPGQVLFVGRHFAHTAPKIRAQYPNSRVALTGATKHDWYREIVATARTLPVPLPGDWEPPPVPEELLPKLFFGGGKLSTDPERVAGVITPPSQRRRRGAS